MEDLSLDSIDLDGAPDVPLPPVDAYNPADLMLDDEEQITLFDVGVPDEVEPPKKISAPNGSVIKPKPRQKRLAPLLPEGELLRPMVEIPDALMDTVIGRLASTVAECLEFPEASVFMALLSSAAACVSTAYAVQYKTHSSISLGLYTIIEQPPATKKSYLLGIGMNPYSMAIGDHNKVIKAKWRESKERKDSEPCSLKLGFGVTTDPSSAAMDRRMADCSEGRFVIASAEQSALISLFPESNSFASTNELILKGWAGEYVAGLRSGRDAFEGMAQGSITLIAQPGSARRVLHASNGSGMAERFIFMSEPDFLGFRQHEGNYPTAEDKAQFERACRSCVKIYSDNILSFANSDEATRATYDPDKLIQLRASHAGYAAIRAKEKANEPRMGELKQSGDMIMLSWLGKYETQVLKIAGIIHAFESHGNGCRAPEVISDRLIEASMQLVDVLADHIQQVLRDAGESGNEAEEEAIISVLERPAPLRRIQQLLRGRKPFRSMQNRGYTAITRRVEAMINAGILVVDTEGRIKVV
jgi:hypothetical protein